ncbi:MAG: serine/threonine protein kinase, partial [Planctomycetota bacterium]
MTNDRLERILVGALDRAGDDRRAFLDDACGPDGALRSRVLELIEAHEGEPGVLEPVDPVDDEEADRLIGRRVGSFTIDRLLAVGGMGSVYVATQDDPHREVALKLIRSGIASRSALRRFRLEAQVLGRLHHPNIAQIFEAGSLDDGNGSVPYFAMEYVPDAEPITQYVGSRRLGTRDRLALLSKVCDAVHHGHQKGVIHRDLKPGNILVDASGNVKVIDFGVARATDSDIAVTTMGTDVGRLMGTLAYMSPEQCAADPDDLDTRSDVYSVGVVLYELVCGRLPYDLQRVPFPEAARVIREEMPTKPSTVDRTLRGDVETIALKALEKDRGRRYQSAADLGRDIDRYLRGEAVEARRPSTTYRLHTFARRHKVAATVLIALLLAVPALTAATVIAARSAERARDEQQRAETALAEAQTIIDFVTESLMATGGAKDLRVVEAMERAIELLDAGDLAGQPRIEAVLRDTIATVLRGNWQVDEAANQAARALEITRALRPGDSDEVADRLHTLARHLDRAWRHDEAVAAWQECLAIRERLSPGDDIGVAAAMHNLAYGLERAGRFDEGLAVDRKVTETKRRLLRDRDRGAVR